MDIYCVKERLDIILDIVNKLKNFKGKNGQIVDLYKEEISFIDDFKKISNEYIKYNHLKSEQNKQFSGSFDFIEIGKRIDYIFPIYKTESALFVIRM
jgi:hypothetical protein